VTEEQFDLVEFTDNDERTKLDNSEPHYATMPICINPKANKQTPQWYKDCLNRHDRSYNPENAQKMGIEQRFSTIIQLSTIAVILQKRL
jgi:hypothetical protein